MIASGALSQRGPTTGLLRHALRGGRASRRMCRKPKNEWRMGPGETRMKRSAGRPYRDSIERWRALPSGAKRGGDPARFSEWFCASRLLTTWHSAPLRFCVVRPRGSEAKFAEPWERKSSSRVTPSLKSKVVVPGVESPRDGVEGACHFPEPMVIGSSVVSRACLRRVAVLRLRCDPPWNDAQKLKQAPPDFG